MPPTKSDTTLPIDKEFKVLDHGFVRLVDVMGDDRAIVQAARVSYGGGTKSKRDDEGLIRYLMSHAHTTPFEMCEIKLHIKLPMFIARQWVRHRTASINEISARYSVLDREFYLPDADCLARQSTTNKQGREGKLPKSGADFFVREMDDSAKRSFASYDTLLGNDDNDHGAITRELARIVLPGATYTQWYWKCNLHNLFHFLALRDSPHAQQEIRLYAHTIGHEIVARWVPMAWRAFCDYRVGGCTLSQNALEVVRSWLQGKKVEQEDSNLSAREWKELHDTLRPRSDS